MKKKLIISILSLLCMQLYAYEERNYLQKKLSTINIKESLSLNQKWINYPNYADRAGWDSLMLSNKEYCIKQGEKYIDFEWVVVAAIDYLDYSRNGNRSVMEAKHNKNVYAISALFIAEMAEGKGRFIDQLSNGIFHMCEMTSWGIAAHMQQQRSKQIFPDHNNSHVLELASGDVGSLFSWIYYFLNKEFDKVHPLITQRLYKEINDRMLTPYLEESHYWWMATGVNANNVRLVNNWNPWCNSNLLQCFLLVENDPERLSKAVLKSMVSIDKFINYYHNDGACEEGPSYWGHAAGKLYDYLQLLYDATGGKVDIFNEPLIKNMGEYISRSYVADGWVVNFADASAKGDPDYRLVYRYGEAIKSNEMMQFASFLRAERSKTISIDRDMYRILADLSCDKNIANTKPAHNPTPFAWYPDTEFCYMSNGRLFFASKGGYNDESHNHNDTGTFSLYVDGYPSFIDVGVGTYTKQTFSKERYSIWTMQSDYHNLPRINGYSQSFGKQYKSKNASADKNKKQFILDIANAYPKSAGVKSWIRSYKLSKNQLIIDDQFDIENASTANQLNFMTFGVVDLSQEGVVSIQIQDKRIQLVYDKKEFTASVEKKLLDDSRLSRVWGSEVQRISLNAKRIENKGNYKIAIKF